MVLEKILCEKMNLLPIDFGKSGEIRFGYIYWILQLFNYLEIDKDDRRERIYIQLIVERKSILVN